MGFENHMNQTCGQLEARGTLVPLQNKFAMATRGGNPGRFSFSVCPTEMTGIAVRHRIES